MDANSTGSLLTLAEAKEAELLKLWPAILYTSVMMVMGSLGNSVVCYVYGFRWQSTVTKTFIFCLALLDLTNSLICMPTEIGMLVHMTSFNAPLWCKLTRFLTYTLNGSSSLILVAIALDRWYKVCRPLQCFFTHRRARWTCVAALVLATSISWPSLVLYGNLTIPIIGTGTMGVMCLVSDDFIDTWWPLVFYGVYFSCYLFLVVAITVLYSMIAVKLVQLRRQQKNRIVATYTGLRSSKLVFHSQESIPLNNAGLADGETKKDVSDTTTDQTKNGEPLKPKFPIVAKIQVLEKKNERRRRSVTFRLPRRSTSSEGKTPGKAGKNGIQLQPPEIIINENIDDKDEECADMNADTNRKKGGEEEVKDSTQDDSREPLVGAQDDSIEPLVGAQDDSREPLVSAQDDSIEPLVSAQDDSREPLVSAQDDRREPLVSAQDVTLTNNLSRGPDGAITEPEDCLPAPKYSEKTQLLSTDDNSYTGSPEDTEDFEQGIHFTVQSDLSWQRNPIIDPNVATCHLPVINNDTQNDTIDVSSDTIDDDMGSKSSLLSGKTKVRATKTCSDSYATPERDGDMGKARIHKTSSDSNLVIPKKHQTLTSARRSFLMLPGGYPGGHTPTSRLPTPEGCPSPNSPGAKPALLSSRQILEMLSKKMAYRPAKTTRMLFAISIVFVISFFPFFCIVITRAAQGRSFFATLTDAGVVAICIFIRSSFISNAANPIIYGLCNKQFRTECGFLLKKCSSRRRDVNLRVIEATDDNLGSNS
ncbi:hypothetical protein ACOMHN_011130 [Nucella lapillus]